MRQRLLALIVLAGLILVGVSPNAQADDGCGYGYGDSYGWLYHSLRYNVPHFAAYPPVYYSYPVPRTYGYSPFAYPPHVMTPEIVGEAKPLTIINPYVPDAEQKKPTSESVDRAATASPQAGPLMITNPFVTPNRSIAVSKQ
jgi:hypothetical protein